MAMFVKSDGRALWPANKAAHIQLEKLARGVPMRVEPKQPRNTPFHNLAYQFFTFVAEALNDGPTPVPWTPDDVKDDLLIETGRTKERLMSKRQRKRRAAADDVVYIICKPVSISYKNMDQAEFSAFMREAFAYVRDELCPWIEDSPHWPDIAAILHESAMLEQAA